MASDGAATQAAVQPESSALARSTARVATLSIALAGLRTQSEVLTERYDHEVSLEQQAAAAYQVAAARFAAARKREQRAAGLLAQQGAADYELAGGQSMAVVLFEGITNPQGYLATLGLLQTLDNRSVDLLAASRGDELVTRLFSAQAASLLGQQRSATQAADFRKAAVIAAVNRQVAVVKAAKASRARLAEAAAAAAAAARRKEQPDTLDS